MAGPFFRPRFADGEGVHEKVEYIHLNPVRAGLVSKAEAWKWSSVRDYAGSVAAPTEVDRVLAVDRVLLPAEGTARI